MKKRYSDVVRFACCFQRNTLSIPGDAVAGRRLDGCESLAVQATEWLRLGIVHGEIRTREGRAGTCDGTWLRLILNDVSE